MKKLTLHIGLHKTGTTFIQTQLLPQLEDVICIRGWHSHRKLMSADFGKAVVISDEGLSGIPQEGNYLKKFISNLEVLRQLYGDPKIIFGVRSHSEFLTSVYKQYLHQKGDKDFDYLYNLADKGMIGHHDLFWNQRVSLLKSMFSEVFIYSLDSMRDRQKDFIAGLQDFLEINAVDTFRMKRGERQNVGVRTNLQVSILKRMNRVNLKLESVHPYLGLYSQLFRKLKMTPRHICQNYLKGVKSKMFAIDPDIEQFIDDYYQKDWLEVVKEISY